MAPLKFNLRGRRFGRLIAESFVPGGWWCQCDCGVRKIVPSQALRDGATQSCGCLNREQCGSLKRTHGHSRSGPNYPEYKIWTGAKSRCQCVTHGVFQHYGGRGITMCQRWADDFMAFLVDMGPRPSAKHSLERIDNDGPYSPDNCRWATHAEQMRNTRRCWSITHNGKTQTIAEWARELGLNYKTLQHRIVTNWPLELALSPKKFTGHVRPTQIDQRYRLKQSAHLGTSETTPLE